MCHFKAVEVFMQRTLEKGLRKRNEVGINIMAESVGRITCNHRVDSRYFGLQLLFKICKNMRTRLKK